MRMMGTGWDGERGKGDRPVGCKRLARGNRNPLHAARERVRCGLQSLECSTAIVTACTNNYRVAC